MQQISNSFNVFMEESGDAGKAFMEAVMKMSHASVLDAKTDEISYISVLAATRMTGGIPFHVKNAKKLGASREEIISAVLVGMPAVGLAVTEAFPIALKSYDEE